MNFLRRLSAFVFFVAAFSPGILFAQTNLNEQVFEQIGGVADVAELGSATTLQGTIAGLIQVFLGLLATIFFILILMSGYWLITARGQAEKYEKAMDTIRRAIIGFVVVLGAYAITYFVADIFTM